MRRLPPLNTLRVFETVGRHLSFGKAADELHITQSAVSHQIRNLETDLGVALFIRKTRAIELTPEGRRYFASMQQVFALLAESTNDIVKGEHVTLRVSLLSSFATNWLIPRLRQFTVAYPEINLQIEPGIGLVDLAAWQADLAIRYGHGDWRGLDSRLLMAERISPVCSPELLARGPALDQPNDLLAHTLLLSYSKEPFEWTAWSRAAGVDLSGSVKSMLHDYNIVLQAALDGQGVAMGRQVLIERHLKAGRLVQPFADYVDGDIGHYLVTAPGKPARHVQAFIDWIEGAAKAGNGGPDAIAIEAKPD